MLTVVGTVAFDTLALVTALASPEKTSSIVELRPDAPGGTAGNVAMSLARLGAPCRLIAPVGPDFAGSAYARALADAGIDARALVVGTLPTARAYIFFEANGAQMTYFHGGATTQLEAHAGAIPGGRAHFCAGELSAYPDLMRQADWVSFDPGQETFHRDFAQIEACLPLADLLFVNRHELAHLEERGWGVRRFLDEGAEAVVETRGGEGTLVHTPVGRFAAHAIGVHAQDPTGAGDAHRAGFLHALERGADLGVAARFANVLGSFAVEQIGAQSGMPTLAEALERYEKAYGGSPFTGSA